MNKLTLALIAALFSGYASASDATIWGGDLDGHFEQFTTGGMDTVASNAGPVDLETAYRGLDGDIDAHVFASNAPDSIQHKMEDDKFYAGLDGYCELAGDV